jgi:hypothetical protein
VIPSCRNGPFAASLATLFVAVTSTWGQVTEIPRRGQAAEAAIDARIPRMREMELRGVPAHVPRFGAMAAGSGSFSSATADCCTPIMIRS